MHRKVKSPWVGSGVGKGGSYLRLGGHGGQPRGGGFLAISDGLTFMEVRKVSRQREKPMLLSWVSRAQSTKELKDIV